MLTLKAITSQVPVVVTERGQAHDGVVWVVQPENFQSLIEHVNKYGGPSFWDIREASQQERQEHAHV